MQDRKTQDPVEIGWSQQRQLGACRIQLLQFTGNEDKRVQLHASCLQRRCFTVFGQSKLGSVEYSS